MYHIPGKDVYVTIPAYTQPLYVPTCTVLYYSHSTAMDTVENEMMCFHAGTLLILHAHPGPDVLGQK